MKPSFLIVLTLMAVVPSACRPIASAAADVPAVPAVYQPRVAPLDVAPVAYRPYRGYYGGYYGYRPFYGYYRPYYAYQPYGYYAPYYYRPDGYGSYPYAYPYAAPYYTTYRYPIYGGYYGRPGFYFGWR
jgi:hypothetical protein